MRRLSYILFLTIRMQWKTFGFILWVLLMAVNKGFIAITGFQYLAAFIMCLHVCLMPNSRASIILFLSFGCFLSVEPRWVQVQQIWPSTEEFRQGIKGFSAPGIVLSTVVC